MDKKQQIHFHSQKYIFLAYFQISAAHILPNLYKRALSFQSAFLRYVFDAFPSINSIK